MRKFRQTVRDAWERHVSGVYPQARAEFDTTAIRLYASPAPLQRRAVAGAHLALVTDEKGAPPAAASPQPAAPDGPARFLAAIAEQIGAAEARAWFGDARMEAQDAGWVLTTPSAFKASWIRSRLAQALDRAAAASGLGAAPDIRVRKA